MQPHLTTQSQWDKTNPYTFHPFEVRNIFENLTRQFIFGKSDLISKKDLLKLYIKTYNEALPENKTLCTIGFIYALHSKEGNFSNGKYIYPLTDEEINLNCNYKFENIITIVQ